MEIPNTSANLTGSGTLVAAPLNQTIHAPTTSSSYKQTFEQIVRQLTEDAERETKNIQQLQAICEVMKKNPSAFDGEDQQLVEQKIQARQDILKHINEDLERRQQTYSSKIVVMENALETREQFFNSLDNHFIDDNQDLFDALAMKQQTLMGLLETMKKELSDPMQPTPLPNT